MIYINLSIKKSKWTNYQDFLGQDKEKKKNEIAFVRWKLSTQDYSNCNALCKQSLSFSCLILASSRKTAWIEWDLCWACVACCWNTVSKTGLIVVRYSAGTAGSVVSVGFSVNECSHFQGRNRFRHNSPSFLLDQEDDKINCSKHVETIHQFWYIKILAWLRDLEWIKQNKSFWDVSMDNYTILLFYTSKPQS